MTFIPTTAITWVQLVHSCGATCKEVVWCTSRSAMSLWCMLLLVSLAAGEDNSTTASPCSFCRMRQELRNLSLAAIKEQVLSKLGMKQAPNMTGRQLPKLPPLRHLIDLYGMGVLVPSQGMQGDEPFKPGPLVLDEEDDFHARTEKVIAFAQPRQ